MRWTMDRVSVLALLVILADIAAHVLSLVVEGVLAVSMVDPVVSAPLTWDPGHVAG